MMPAGRTRPVASLPFVLSCLLLSLLVLPSRAGAPPVKVLLTGHLELTVGDAVDPEARVYRTEGGVPRVLVESDQLPGPVLVLAGEKKARLLPADAVGPVEGDPDARAVDASAPPLEEASIAVQRGKVRFTLAGKTLVLGPGEPMLGDQSPEALLARMPEYRRNAAKYVPARGDLALLRRVEGQVEVLVLFGTWCPHCERFVPRLIRVVRELGEVPGLSFRFVGLTGEIENDELARKYGVQGVPTAIVLRDGKVVGKIYGAAWEHPEAALTTILFGDAAAGA